MKNRFGSVGAFARRQWLVDWSSLRNRPPLDQFRRLLPPNWKQLVVRVVYRSMIINVMIGKPTELTIG